MKTTTTILLAALLIALPFCDAWAAATKSIALVMKVSGNVEFKKAESTKKGNLTFGTTLNDGDWIRTGADGKVKLIFTDDKSMISLNPGTEVTINGKRDDQANISKRISMEVGQLFAKIEKQRGTLEIATPTSVASVKGTDFWVTVEVDGTTFIVTLEGLVELMNRISGAIVEVGKGQTGESNPNGENGVTPTLPDGIPEYEGDEERGTVRINLEGPDGETKTIEIEYREEED